MNIRSAALGAAVALLLGGFSSAASAAALGTNLIKNSGAEEGEGASSNSVVSIPHWTATGKFTAIKYGVGDFPDSDDSDAVSGGANFFAGGPGNALSSLSQTIDLSSLASLIDSELLTATLGGFLGGFAEQEDNLTLTALFLDASGSAIGDAFGPPTVTADDRGDETGFLFRSISMVVPAEARSVLITLTSRRSQGTSNDGYADNLSFVLGQRTSVPEPAALGVLGLGLAGLGFVRRRKS